MWSTRPNSNTAPSALLNADPDEYVQCPYDPHHKILAGRYSHHLKRCRKIHGDVMKTCPFNESHHIPADQYDDHIRTCVDRVTIRQDIERDVGLAPFLPRPAAPRTTLHSDEEDWGAEVEEERTQQGFKDFMAEDPIDEFEDEDKDVDVEEVHNMQPASTEGAVFDEPLLVEKPPNWDTMTAAQKKNYKRKYKRQQERLKASGYVHEERSKNPKDWTEEERKQRIDAILAKYPLAYKAHASFTDYKSLLNQICQKCKINQPIYQSADSDSEFGGFGAACIVKSEVYRSRGYERTKQGAEHNAAKWALLSLDIPLEGDVQGRIPTNVEEMRRKDEMRRLAVNTVQQQQQVKKLRQPCSAPPVAGPQSKEPITQTGSLPATPPSNQTRQTKEMISALGKLQFSGSSQLKESSDEPDLEWQTVGPKKQGGVKVPVGGRGWGRGRGRGNWNQS